MMVSTTAVRSCLLINWSPTLRMQRTRAQRSATMHYTTLFIRRAVDVSATPAGMQTFLPVPWLPLLKCEKLAVPKFIVREITSV